MSALLVLRCSACKRKLWKYDKIGSCELLRCHKDRITNVYGFEEEWGRARCLCGQTFGIDKGTYYKMIAKAFTYSGTKRNS